MKKFMTAFLSAALILSMSMAAFADEEDETAAGTAGQAAEQTAAAQTADQTAEQAAGDDTAVDVILAAEPDEVQDAVIMEILPNILYYWLDQDVVFADVDVEDIINNLYGILNDAYWQDSAIVTYLGRVDDDEFMNNAFDKVSALKNVGDIFGRTLTDDDIIAFNAQRGWDSFRLTDEAICISGADGEGASIPDLVLYSVDGDKLIATVLFTTYYNDDSEIPGCDIITFKTNPDSFFGYSLESLVSI